MNQSIALLIICTGLGLSLGLNGCNSTSSQSSPPVAPATSSSAKPAASPVPPTSSKPPLTVAKLKNAEYYILAKGPIKLTDGKYEDPESKRSFVMDEVVTYGDLNQDGIKDAATSIKVTVPNSGDFSYLVAVVNQAGNPKHISAEFLGPRVRVKTLEIKHDRTIAATMEQYQPNDPACCPSVKITSTYKLKDLPTATTATPTKK
ncbi:hypothetical protein [Pantanalinema sp. GBBB05]|uniref:hypothetical protein n=1 Tax=Pantanalinema sp. GBBB05 TaxID=2604139 RepID=UPI001DFDB158|nr:hypothetical protein [Pantanalinema sp. GBBB05]